MNNGTAGLFILFRFVPDAPNGHVIERDGVGAFLHIVQCESSISRTQRKPMSRRRSPWTVS
jgi:hypothetical protein